MYFIQQCKKNVLRPLHIPEPGKRGYNRTCCTCYYCICFTAYRTPHSGYSPIDNSTLHSRHSVSTVQWGPRFKRLALFGTCSSREGEMGWHTTHYDQTPLLLRCTYPSFPCCFRSLLPTSAAVCRHYSTMWSTLYSRSTAPLVAARCLPQPVQHGRGVTILRG